MRMMIPSDWDNPMDIAIYTVGAICFVIGAIACLLCAIDDWDVTKEYEICMCLFTAMGYLLVRIVRTDRRLKKLEDRLEADDD